MILFEWFLKKLKDVDILKQQLLEKEREESKLLGKDFEVDK